MNNLHIQMLLAAGGYYDGGLDGDFGPKSKAAVKKILHEIHDSLPGLIPKNWSDKRNAIAAAQALLKNAGYEPGVVDGLYGHNTRESFNAWNYTTVNGKPEKLSKKVPQIYVPPKGRFKIPKQRDCKIFYGKPGPEIEKQLVSLPVPYPMRIDWNLAQKATTIRIHKKCAPALKAALEEVLGRYGHGLLVKLGLNRYAGAYNHRKMRGGSSWSMHAYGCAIDFYAQPNGLRMRCPQALFCGLAYVRFVDIMEKHGWVSLGRVIGRDWMHFQRATI